MRNEILIIIIIIIIIQPISTFGQYVWPARNSCLHFTRFLLNIVDELEKELQNEYLPEDEAYESKLENNALFHRQGKTYERRRRWSNIKKVLGARKSSA